MLKELCFFLRKNLDSLARTLAIMISFLSEKNKKYLVACISIIYWVNVHFGKIIFEKEINFKILILQSSYSLFVIQTSIAAKSLLVNVEKLKTDKTSIAAK